MLHVVNKISLNADSSMLRFVHHWTHYSEVFVLLWYDTISLGKWFLKSWILPCSWTEFPVFTYHYVVCKHSKPVTQLYGVIYHSNVYLIHTAVKT